MRGVRRPRLAFWAGAVMGLAILLLLAPAFRSTPDASGLAPQTSGPAAHPESTTFTANVTFQGFPTSQHSTPGTAIPTSFGGIFTSVFTWSSPGRATLVTRALVAVLFLGADVGTSANSIDNAVPNTTGAITLQSDFSQNKYLFEGVYELDASLFDHGQAIYNTTFYVWVQAPYHLTVVNVALLLIGIYEIWQIAALGSARAARKQLGLEPAPKKETK